jgi:outer membrane protein OmpA-like peptidoglycan-associated protein
MKPTTFGSARPGRALRGRVLCLALGLVPAAVFQPVPAEGEPHAGARLPQLELRIDPDDVDIERGQLTATLSRPAAKLSVKVLDAAGAVLAEAEQAFDGAAAGSALVIRWQPPRGTVARIEVFGHDTNGYYKGIAITPWSFEVPHEDVVFETDSAQVLPAEEKKLAASLRLINQELPRAKNLGAVTLFILAHTDTVGSGEYNRALSTRRAQAIARWFRGHGLKIPMAYDGMGESMLEVKTADEVDEPRNRRVDYMLGVEPPRFKQSKVLPAWKKI